MRVLPIEQWPKLTVNHRWALRILDDAGSNGVIPVDPPAMKRALHDLWRFGFADRKFQEGRPMTYQITFIGMRAHSILARGEQEGGMNTLTCHRQTTC